MSLLPFRDLQCFTVLFELHRNQNCNSHVVQRLHGGLICQQQSIGVIRRPHAPGGNSSQRKHPYAPYTGLRTVSRKTEVLAKGLMQPERGAIVTPGAVTAVAGLARRVPISVDRVDYQVVPPFPGSHSSAMQSS